MDRRNGGGDGPLAGIWSALGGSGRFVSGKSVHSGSDERLFLDWLESVSARGIK